MAQKILIIENDADIRNLIAFILEEEGFAVAGMPSPESLETVVRHQPDLVLIDEWVAGHPGHRLCLRIKLFHQLMHVPVIILSTASDIEKIVTECKADGFIRKPFDVTELVEVVQEQLVKRA
ncbi:MAG: response regulator transcription factor [Bacteroidetes bacterium]|nr:response regulator transcription factor [Bacteroidota bacterium]